MLFTDSAHAADDNLDVEDFAAWHFKVIKRAAEKGNVSAQNRLGHMYDSGYGVPEDDAAAVYWFQKADAHTFIGDMYYRDGDYVEAALWYRKDAVKGYAGPQFDLGSIYYGSHAGPRDPVEAMRWFRKAAEQGHIDAQYQLGFMYFTGDGVPEDKIQAYAWISIAAAQGVENANNTIATLTGEMTRAEIVEAQKLSRKYWEAFGPGLNTQ